MDYKPFKNNLCDQAIFEGQLDAFFHEQLITLASHHQKQSEILNEFLLFSAYLLKHRYFLRIDAYLDPIEEIQEQQFASLCHALEPEMDQIDAFFEPLYRNLRDQYVRDYPELVPFFHEYHRRDLKQDAMLRAFALVRKRLISTKEGEVQQNWVALYKDAFREQDLQMGLKCYFSLAGIQKRTHLSRQERRHELTLLHNQNTKEGTLTGQYQHIENRPRKKYSKKEEKLTFVIETGPFFAEFSTQINFLPKAIEGN